MLSNNHITINTSSGSFKIKTFNSDNVIEKPYNTPVNIFASGPSIANMDFNDSLTSVPSVFVNGSLSLLAKHQFSKVIAYVISDERFIRNNAEILKQYYMGQPLYITQSVLYEIVKKLPYLIEQYYQSIRIIFAVDRPLIQRDTTLSFKPLKLLNNITSKKVSLNDFNDDTNFVIKKDHYSKPIGVSLNIEKGFVEAGTVAFIAAQLAFTLGASEINLYGIDLINSDQPRFYESKNNVAPCKLDKAITERIVPSFDLLAKEYKKHDVRVINHSPISKDLFNNLDIPSDSY